MGMGCVRSTVEGVVIRLRIVPRASSNAVVGVHGDAVKIRLQAPPVDGKANKDLLRYLSKRLGVARSSLSLVSGERSREKEVLVRGSDEQAVRARLGLDTA